MSERRRRVNRRLNHLRASHSAWAQGTDASTVYRLRNPHPRLPVHRFLIAPFLPENLLFIVRIVVHDGVASAVKPIFFVRL